MADHATSQYRGPVVCLKRCRCTGTFLRNLNASNTRLEMPNGGSYCCANCAFNPKGGVCELRDVIILGHAAWTYCDNCSHSARTDVEIRGPIFASGLYEGYVRIPWLGDRPPLTGCAVKCFDCGDHVENGIGIELRTGERFGFCCNRNYVLWWSSRRPNRRPLSRHPDQYGLSAAWVMADQCALWS